MRRPSFLALTLGLACAAAPPAWGQDSPVAPRVRSPAAVMSFRGAEWLERPQRVAEEMPAQVIEVMGLAPGDAVADVGAGSGFFTRRMARLVAPGGTVYAVDVQPEMLEILMENIEEEGLEGVVPVLGEAGDPNLPAGAIDWMLLVDVYHEFAEPEAMLARMREALAPGGRVALLEYRVEDGTGDHIRAEHRMSVRQVLAEWETAGFQLLALHEFLPSQHLFVFGAGPRGAPSTAAAPRHYDLADALRSGRVELSVAGAGSDALALTIRRTVPEAMVVTLPAGSYFEAAGEAGDMVARRDGMVVLREDGPRAWRVQARRAERAPRAPATADRLTLRPDGPTEVADLMWLFQGVDIYPAVAPTVEQIGLWIVTDDAGWEDLAAHARAGSVHQANAVALAAAYVNASGIDLRGRRIWSERASFADQITDQGLQRVFAELEGR